MFDGVFVVIVVMTVVVEDVNDEVPVLVFAQDLALMEEMPVGSVLQGIFSAVDHDHNDNLTYYVQGSCHHLYSPGAKCRH